MGAPEMLNHVKRYVQCENDIGGIFTVSTMKGMDEETRSTLDNEDELR